MSATEASENVLGKTIKTLLKVRGLKAYELGEDIGLSPTSVSKIINGVTRPRQNTFTRMCQALCKTKDEERRLVAAFAGTELLDEEPDQALPSRSGWDLARFDWSKFDLVVIDESHNFRNRIERDEEEGFTRYQRLLYDVIKSNQKTKVLLLSATPVNNSLKDLRNQISIITTDNDAAFEQDGIPSVSSTLNQATRAISQWNDDEDADKSQLLDALPSIPRREGTGVSPRLD